MAPIKKSGEHLRSPLSCLGDAVPGHAMGQNVIFAVSCAMRMSVAAAAKAP